MDAGLTDQVSERSNPMKLGYVVYLKCYEARPRNPEVYHVLNAVSIGLLTCNSADYLPPITSLANHQS